MRPTDYKPEYCQMLIDHMSQGYGYISFGADINVGKSTLYRWEEEHKEWKEAKAIGYAKGLKFFETLLTSDATGVMPKSLKAKGSKKINSNNVLFVLRTRFHQEYKEQMAVDNTSSDGSLTVSFVAPNKKNKKEE